MNAIYTVILAAGQGKRMKSTLPKVLHPVAGKPMIFYSLALTRSLVKAKRFLVLGHQIEKIKEIVKALDEEIIVIHQSEQLGTAHAIRQLKPYLIDLDGIIIVLSADVPLLRETTLQKMITYHQQSSAYCTLLTARISNPEGYGRVIRNETGEILEIVEQSEASAKQKRINEINVGVYCFESKELFKALALVQNDNYQREYYLTDVVKIMRSRGGFIDSISIEDREEITGINTQQELAYVSQVMYRRNLLAHMDQGVTIVSPTNTFIESQVEIGKGTIIYPFTIITAGSKIGSNCHIGPYSHIIQSNIGEQTKVFSSVVEKSQIGNNASIGPYAHIRPECIIQDEVKIGNYVETKKTSIGQGSKVGHLTYLGDSTLGRKVNIGAGTITCNFDGIRKNPTIIEDGAFIGSNNSLVAPVTIGKDAYTAAGSTITENIPAQSLAIGRSRQKNIIDWVKKKKGKRNIKKKNNKI